jgi:lysozyme family protein
MPSLGSQPLPAPSKFDVAVAHVLREEGGLVDNPKDTGGRTNYGITQRVLDAMRDTYPLAGLPLRVDELTPGQAIDIYRSQYWMPVRGDDMPAGIGLALLDSAVNQGANRAAKWLQFAAGVQADGWIGARTIAAVYATPPLALLSEFCARRAYHYMLQDSIDDEFGLGWARRLFRTFNAAVKELDV